MSSQRRLGVLVGVLAFLGISAAALFSTYQGDFVSGLAGIEADLETKSEARLTALGIADALVEADGQNISVVIPAGWDPESVEAALLSEDGVRKVEVTLRADSPEPTVEPVPTEAPAPTAEPAVTAEPAPTEPPDPTAPPEPTEAPEPTATAAPGPAPTVAPPTALEVLASLDLSAVTFEPGTARLTTEATAGLDDIAAALGALDGALIEVQGHTDAFGDPDANLLLSQQRAVAVADYLAARGVDASTLTARGYGSARPVADNSTEQGRAANRRVALVLAEGN